MFERYTEQARRSLFFARYEASLLGSISIEPSHLLLGILRTGQDTADLVPAATAEAVRQDLLQGIADRPPVSTSVEIPFSHAARRVLETAASEADALHHSHIGTEHLLLALASSTGNGADVLLETHGLEASALREQIRHRPVPSAGPPPMFTVGNPATLAPDVRREAALRQLDAVVALVKSIGDERAGMPDARRLVEQICRDLIALKAAISES